MLRAALAAVNNRDLQLFAVRAVDIADRKEIFFPEFACRPRFTGTGNDALGTDRFVTEK